MDKAHKAWTGIPAPGRDIISCLVAQEGRRRKDTGVAQAEAAKGEAVLDQAERAAEEMDYEAEGEILQAREASHAIVDEAIERGVDAIVLGIEYKKPLGEFQLDHTAQYILKHAPCEVWLYRGPAVMK